ncbi:MAG: SurA N-terminal domain-containing protein [Coraliomargaritaceae bacterium]
MILKLFISTAFFCVLLAQLNANSTVKESDFIPQLGNGIAAIVEGEIITFEDLRTSIDPLVSKLRLQAKNESDFKKLIDQVSKDILQNKIDRIIIVKSAEKEGLQIPSSYINQEYESVIEQQFEGNRSQFLAYLKLIGKNARGF